MIENEWTWSWPLKKIEITLSSIWVPNDGQFIIQSMCRYLFFFSTKGTFVSKKPRGIYTFWCLSIWVILILTSYNLQTLWMVFLILNPYMNVLQTLIWTSLQTLWWNPTFQYGVIFNYIVLMLMQLHLWMVFLVLNPYRLLVVHRLRESSSLRKLVYCVFYSHLHLGDNKCPT